MQTGNNTFQFQVPMPNCVTDPFILCNGHAMITTHCSEFCIVIYSAKIPASSGADIVKNKVNALS